MTEMSDLFKAMGDENRMAILKWLSWGELCACDLQKHTALTQPTISHHMKILQQAGLVKGEKRGKWMYYSLNHDTVKSCTQTLNDFLTPDGTRPFTPSCCE